jgi:hypothetical protein
MGVRWSYLALFSLNKCSVLTISMIFIEEMIMGLHIKDIFKLMETFIEARDMLARELWNLEFDYSEERMKDTPIKKLVTKMNIIIKESHEKENREEK